MDLYYKMKWILGILVIFILIVVTNLIDKNNFSKVKDSVITVYEDRLVVNDIIFQLSRDIQKKEVALAKSDTAFFLEDNSELNEEIEGLVKRFEDTKLISEEEKVLSAFKENVKELSKSETTYLQSKFFEKNDLEQSIVKVRENLYKLSKIQLNEGNRQTTISKNAIASHDLFFQMEIYLLILLAIVIQIIVMYKPRNKSKSKSKSMPFKK